MYSEHPPLCPVPPEHPEHLGILGLHLVRLVPPNTLVSILATWGTCHCLIPSEHVPLVSFCSDVLKVYLPDSGSPMALIHLGMPHSAPNPLPALETGSSRCPHPASAIRAYRLMSAPSGTLHRLLTLSTTCWSGSRNPYTCWQPAGTR